MIDLHTASAGRVNSLYVRADMNDPVTFRMAMLQHPQIVVHSTGPDRSLRDSCMLRGALCGREPAPGAGACAT